VRLTADLEEIQALLRAYEGPREPILRPRAARRARRPIVLVGGFAAAALAAGILAVIDRAGGGPASTSRATSGRCASTIVWRGVTYSGSQTNATLVVGDRFADVRLPTCVDRTVNGKPVEGDTGVTASLVKIQGIDPSIAFAVAGDNETAYIAAGYFPQVRLFPLHRLFYGTDEDPNEFDASCAPGNGYRMRGTLLSADFGHLTVRVESASGSDGVQPGRVVRILPDVHTRMSPEFGNPSRVNSGASLGIAVRECLPPGGASSPKLVATEIGP